MNDVEKVIREIFTRQPGLDLDLEMAESVPGYDDIYELATLLAGDPPELALQSFFDHHPKVLLSYFGGGDASILACLVQPPIGTQFRADFALLRYHQDGFGIFLIELERPSARLFTKKLTPLREYQNAIGQILDWKQWIELNKSTFTREMIRLAKEAPLFADRGKSGSFRMRHQDLLERVAREYGSEFLPFTGFDIVIGRWGNLSEEERRRLILVNRENRGYATRTYDQIARQAFASPWRGY